MSLIRRFDISGNDPTRLWTPREVSKTELDNMPRCVRCSRRCKQSVAIEAYLICDMADKWIDVEGVCKGRCENPSGPTTEHPLVCGQDNWRDHVRISWAHFSDAKFDEMFRKDLVKQIAAIKFFEPEDIKGVAA